MMLIVIPWDYMKVSAEDEDHRNLGGRINFGYKCCCMNFEETSLKTQESLPQCVGYAEVWKERNKNMFQQRSIWRGQFVT